MTKKQEVVKEKAEQPAEVEPTPAKEVEEATPVVEATEKAADTQPEAKVTETPAVELEQPEKKVSDSVPYDRFKEQNEELKDLKEKNAYLEAMKKDTPQVPDDSPRLDEQSELAVNRQIRQQIETEKSVDFERKNKEVLSDRLVKTAFESIIKEKMESKVPYIDRDESLKEAQELISSRLKKDMTKAKDSGVEEGEKLAQQKQQSAAVGEPGKANKPAESELTAEEFAAQNNLPRV